MTEELPDESWTAAPYEARWILLGTLLCEGGLLLLAMGIGLGLRVPPWAQFAWSPGAAAMGLAATVPLAAGLVLVSRYPLGPFQRLQRETSKHIVPLFRDCSLMQLLAISALAGMGEEVLFRGAFQSVAQQWGCSPWTAILLVAALFGVAHPITPFYALLAGLIGIYLGWLLLLSENLLAPIIAHTAYDFFALVYLLRRGPNTAPSK